MVIAVDPAGVAVLPFIVVVLVLAVPPIVILVVEPAAPFIPIVIVLVLPLAVIPLLIATVCEAVDWPIVILPVPDVRPSVINPATVGVTTKLAVPTATLRPLATPVIFVTPVTLNTLEIVTVVPSSVIDDCVNAVLPLFVLTSVFAAEKLVAFVPPLAIGRVPVTPVVKGSPVALVRVTADGVPRFGVVNTGDVASATTVPLPVVV